MEYLDVCLALLNPQYNGLIPASTSTNVLSSFVATAQASKVEDSIQRSASTHFSVAKLVVDNAASKTHNYKLPIGQEFSVECYLVSHLNGPVTFHRVCLEFEKHDAASSQTGHSVQESSHTDHSVQEKGTKGFSC